jgi:hypothetical protein
VDDPYYNEPGTSPSRDKVSARQYVHMVREATIRHAIAGQLGKPSSIWKSVILDHFALTKGQIYEMAAKWVEEAPEVAAPCGYGDVGCKGIRSTMREAYREMQMAFDKLTFVKYLNDFESKFYPEDGEYDDDDEDIDDEDTDDEDEMKEESKQSEEKEDQEKLFLLELALKDPSIPMSKKQLKKLSQEDRQRRQEVEEEQYMNTLYQMCLKDASILNLFPSRVQKNEDFLKRVLAGNCQLLQYVSSVELMLKLIDSLPLPTEAMKIISLPEKEESKNNNSHNNNNNNTFSTFSFNPAPVSNAKSQYAFDFDYSESSEDSDVDENENENRL